MLRPSEPDFVSHCATRIAAPGGGAEGNHRSALRTGETVGRWKSRRNNEPAPRAIASLLIAALLALSAPCASASTLDVILVVGHPGEAEYGEQFEQWSERIRAGLEPSADEFLAVGLPGHAGDHATDKQRLVAAIDQQNRDVAHPLCLIFIGHGTANRSAAKFNLVGPDISASELAAALEPLQRPLIVINCASASGPFVDALSGANRVIVTATRSESEYNFARFGNYFSQAIAEGAADIDHDTEVSVLEAFLAASAGVQQFYNQEGRIASEHAIIDDNGDRRGTPADFFRAGRVVKQAKDGVEPDGANAGRRILVPSDDPLPFTRQQLARREELEAEIAALRDSKAELSADEYYSKLLVTFTELARLYQSAEAAKAGGS